MTWIRRTCHLERSPLFENIIRTFLVYAPIGIFSHLPNNWGYRGEVISRSDELWWLHYAERYAVKPMEDRRIPMWTDVNGNLYVGPNPTNAEFQDFYADYIVKTLIQPGHYNGVMYDCVWERIEFFNKVSMIICDNSGSEECFEGVSNSSSDIYDYHFYAELYHLDGLINEFTKSYRETKPWLFGEYYDSDTFRLTSEVKERTTGEAWWIDPDERANLLRQVHKGFGSDLPIYHQDQILDRTVLRKKCAESRN